MQWSKVGKRGETACCGFESARLVSAVDAVKPFCICAVFVRNRIRDRDHDRDRKP